MDFKFMIILLILVVLLIIIHKELKSIRHSLDNIDQFEENVADLSNKINVDISQYIDQIREISADNLQELKKINMINHQHVISNHFSETEDSDIKTDVNYLSETCEDNDNQKYMIFKEQNNNVEPVAINSNYYMSETDNVNKTEHSSFYNDQADSIIIPTYLNKQMIENESDNSINEQTSNIDRTENTQFCEDEDNVNNVDNDEVNNLLLMINSDQNDLRGSFSENIIMSKDSNEHLIDDSDSIFNEHDICDNDIYVNEDNYSEFT